MNRTLFLFLLLTLPLTSAAQKSPLVKATKPTISFTFDDGSTAKRLNYPFEEWNAMLLKKLEDADVKAALFLIGDRTKNAKGKQLVKSWNDAGHIIGNHTWSHPNLNDSTVTLEQYQAGVLKTDALIKEYGNYRKLFRYPYLREGNTFEKVNGMREFLEMHNYKNGYVTIDDSDWFIDQRMRERFDNDSTADLSEYRDFYLKHIYDYAEFYEALSYKMNDRHVKHTLLLHHNIINALFVDELIRMFRDKGWEVVAADEAFKDPIYDTIPRFPGQGLIYAHARDREDWKEVLKPLWTKEMDEMYLMNQAGL